MHLKILIPSVALAATIAASISNPSQERHLGEIAKIIERQKISTEGLEDYAIMKHADYNNYFVFSTMTFAGSRFMEQDHMLSYGFFGTVKTTGDIQAVIAMVNKWWANKQKESK